MAWSDDCIYYDRKTPCRDPDEHRRCTGSWRGVVSLGHRPGGRRIRRKVPGQIKTEVRDKLRDLHTDIEAGLRKPQAATVRAPTLMVIPGRGRSWTAAELGRTLGKRVAGNPQEFESPILRHAD